MAENLQMVLDNQNSWIYVIDPDTYALKYINARPTPLLRRPVWECRVTKLSLKEYSLQNLPCARYPVNINQTMEVYNPVLKVWSMADASYIRWESQDAVCSPAMILRRIRNKTGDAARY